MTQRMSRVQRIILIYMLWELQKPRLIQRLTRQFVGGGGVTKKEAVAAVEAEVGLSLSGHLDLPEITPPANPSADTLRLYVEDFKGFPFFSFRDATGMVRKLVRDSVFVGKNETGTSIPANRAVYAVGSVDDVPSIGKARANSSATMPCIGVTLEAIADGAFGRIMQVGLVENVDTSTFAAGNVLYVSATTAGILVASAPTYPNIPQEIGTILVSDAAVGAVQVVARSMFNHPEAIAAVEGEATLELLKDVANAKLEIFEDHSRYGVNDRFPVIKLTSYYFGTPYAGIGIMDYGLYGLWTLFDRH